MAIDIRQEYVLVVTITWVNVLERFVSNVRLSCNHDNRAPLIVEETNCNVTIEYPKEEICLLFLHTGGLSKGKRNMQVKYYIEIFIMSLKADSVTNKV